MGITKMYSWLTAAAESCMSGSRNFRIWQRSPLIPIIPLSPSNHKDSDPTCHGGKPYNPTICNMVMVCLSVTAFTSTLILLQSLKTTGQQDMCFLPRDNVRGSLQTGSSWRSEAKNNAHMDEMEGLIPNSKAWLLKQAEGNGTTSCDQLRTTQALMFGLEQPGRGNISLQTNQYHQILVVSYSEDGTRRCTGGDFYETDLSGANWKSRPPVKDLGDGSYLVNLRVDSQMSGVYTFKVVLLFSNLHGLDLCPDNWVQIKEVIHVQIEFINPSSDASQSTLRICTHEDFKMGFWQGRWTRSNSNESCAADDEGRFKCLSPTVACERPWCEGPLGRLESNGWVYSAHCAFHLFSQKEAWTCLQGRWLFFWGDSNHQDTIRNLLNFVLGRQEGGLTRTFESTFSNPGNSSQVLKITSFFNGHYQESGNNLGLSSLNNSDYRRTIQSYFQPSHQAVPDTVILNSGLHDGKFWDNLTHYAEGAKMASTFWESIWRNASPDESGRPRFVFRTTVAPAGVSRKMPANPQKMEIFNTVLGEELSSKFGQTAFRIVDAYDMTFPWHYDNMHSDGGHYGRPPSLNAWQGITTGHHYFVDLMLGHVLLNAICPL